MVPGGPIYKGERNPPQGPVRVVTETGEKAGEEGQKYAETEAESGKALLKSVANDTGDGKTGEGGCMRHDGADPSAMGCTPTNPKNPAYVGYAQPVGAAA